MSKITAQFVGFKSDPAINGAVGALIAKKAFAVKVVNRQDMALAFAQRLPASSLIVFRDQAWQKTQEPGFTERLLTDPDREALKWIDHHQPILAANPRLVCETMNEWAGWDWSDANQMWVLYPPRIRAYAHYEARIAEVMFAHGYPVALGHYATMHPPYEASQYMTESLQAAEKYRSFWCQHCYDSPHLSTRHGDTARPEDITFRYHEWWTRANGPTLYPHVELLVTEFGIDDIGGNGLRGWREVMNAPLMAAELYGNITPGYADSVFNSHPELRAVFWYRFGHDQDNADDDPTFQFDALDYAQPPRADFDLAKYIIDHVSAAGEVVPVPAPIPAPPPVIEAVRSYVVVSRGGLNIRATPDKSRSPVGFLPCGFPFLARPIGTSWVTIDGVGVGQSFYLSRQDGGTTLIKEAG